MRDINPRDLASELEANILIQQPVMLWGAGGVGKSSIYRQVQQKLGMAMIDVRVNLLEPVDLRGIPNVVNNITQWAQPDFLPRVEEHGERGIVLFDELPNAMKATQSASYQIVLDRCLGNYELPDGWVVMAAGNRQTDRGGTFEMPAPLKNRFAHYVLEPNIDDWVVWAAKNLIDPMIIAFLRFRSELLYNFDPEHNAYPTPRTWHLLHNRMTKAPPAANEWFAVQSLVGEGAAGEFLTFKRTFDSMPDIDNIIAKPKKAPVPDDDPATMFAISGALAARANPENFENILVYTERMPPEFQVILARDAITRTPELHESESFNAWAAKNADVIL